MFDGLLLHQLRVKRQTGITDRFKQPDARQFRYILGAGYTDDPTAATTWPCRMTTASGGERFEERSREVYVVRHNIYVSPGVDVREDDRAVVNDGSLVLLPDGNILVVKRVYDMDGLHHVTLGVEVVRSPIAA